MNQPNQIQETAFTWDVKIADTLRLPVTIIAIEKGKEIRQVVTEVVTEYIKKQTPKVGE